MAKCKNCGHTIVKGDIYNPYKHKNIGQGVSFICRVGKDCNCLRPEPEISSLKFLGLLRN